VGYRWMYYLTGLPGWMRWGFGPGWSWVNPWWPGYGFPGFAPYAFGYWTPVYPWYGPQAWWW